MQNRLTRSCFNNCFPGGWLGSRLSEPPETTRLGAPFGRPQPPGLGFETASRLSILLLLAIEVLWGRSAIATEPIPDKLVVLTFDDSVRSHFTVVRPILLDYEFGATFFITEGFDFKPNKQDYMTWEQIAQLHRDGFEIGNHTRGHMGVTE